MTANLDLSPEAVERLASRCSGLSKMRGALQDDALSEASATLRALSAENARLRAERDAAWQAGAEAMQKVAARTAVATPATRSDKAGVVWHDGFTSGCLHAADAIRALPIPASRRRGRDA